MGLNRPWNNNKRNQFVLKIRLFIIVTVFLVQIEVLSGCLLKYPAASKQQKIFLRLEEYNLQFMVQFIFLEVWTKLIFCSVF